MQGARLARTCFFYSIVDDVQEHQTMS